MPDIVLSRGIAGERIPVRLTPLYLSNGKLYAITDFDTDVQLSKLVGFSDGSYDNTDTMNYFTTLHDTIIPNFNGYVDDEILYLTEGDVPGTSEIVTYSGLKNQKFYIDVGRKSSDNSLHLQVSDPKRFPMASTIEERLVILESDNAQQQADIEDLQNNGLPANVNTTGLITGDGTVGNPLHIVNDDTANPNYLLSPSGWTDIGTLADLEPRVSTLENSVTDLNQGLNDLTLEVLNNTNNIADLQASSIMNIIVDSPLESIATPNTVEISLPTVSNTDEGKALVVSPSGEWVVSDPTPDLTALENQVDTLETRVTDLESNSLTDVTFSQYPFSATKIGTVVNLSVQDINLANANKIFSINNTGTGIEFIENNAIVNVSVGDSLSGDGNLTPLDLNGYISAANNTVPYKSNDGSIQWEVKSKFTDTLTATPLEGTGVTGDPVTLIGYDAANVGDIFTKGSWIAPATITQAVENDIVTINTNITNIQNSLISSVTSGNAPITVTAGINTVEVKFTEFASNPANSGKVWMLDANGQNWVLDFPFVDLTTIQNQVDGIDNRVTTLENNAVTNVTFNEYPFQAIRTGNDIAISIQDISLANADKVMTVKSDGSGLEFRANNVTTTVNVGDSIEGDGNTNPLEILGFQSAAISTVPTKNNLGVLVWETISTPIIMEVLPLSESVLLRSQQFITMNDTVTVQTLTHPFIIPLEYPCEHAVYERVQPANYNDSLLPSEFEGKNSTPVITQAYLSNERINTEVLPNLLYAEDFEDTVNCIGNNKFFNDEITFYIADIAVSFASHPEYLNTELDGRHTLALNQTANRMVSSRFLNHTGSNIDLNANESSMGYYFAWEAKISSTGNEGNTGGLYTNLWSTISGNNAGSGLIASIYFVGSPARRQLSIGDVTLTNFSTSFSTSFKSDIDVCDNTWHKYFFIVHQTNDNIWHGELWIDGILRHAQTGTRPDIPIYGISYGNGNSSNLPANADIAYMLYGFVDKGTGASILANPNLWTGNSPIGNEPFYDIRNTITNDTLSVIKVNKAVDIPAGQVQLASSVLSSRAMTGGLNLTLTDYHLTDGNLNTENQELNDLVRIGFTFNIEDALPTVYKWNGANFTEIGTYLDVGSSGNLLSELSSGFSTTDPAVLNNVEYSGMGIYIYYAPMSGTDSEQAKKRWIKFKDITFTVTPSFAKKRAPVSNYEILTYLKKTTFRRLVAGSADALLQVQWHGNHTGAVFQEDRLLLAPSDTLNITYAPTNYNHILVIDKLNKTILKTSSDVDMLNSGAGITGFDLVFTGTLIPAGIDLVVEYIRS